jgi:hypothetical protein
VSFEVDATGRHQPFVAEHLGAQQSFLFFSMFFVDAHENGSSREMSFVAWSEFLFPLAMPHPSARHTEGEKGQGTLAVASAFSYQREQRYPTQLSLTCSHAAVTFNHRCHCHAPTTTGNRGHPVVLP